MTLATATLRTLKTGNWKGMNEKVSPDQLPSDVLANIQNCLLDETPGTVVKRQGSRRQTILPSGRSPRDTYQFTKLDGTSYLLISDGQNLYYTTDPNSAYSAAIKTGLNEDGFMAFETAENKVWMSNGIDAVMSWDGTTLITFDRDFTSTTNLTTVSTTSFIHAGLTSSDDYWVGMKLVFTNGAGAPAGTVVTVTDYVEATQTITFTPAVTGIAAADRFSVGVQIPRGSTLRYYDGRLFIGCTADNQAELRFSEISDPSTGEVQTLDNPQAWPAANELALTVLDQERLWGITPILRDRILVHKATGLFRVERDPLVKYRLEVVSRSIGSRFPDTWAEKKNILYFLGQDKDGLPEVYKTDMVDVSLVDPDGGVEPTLRGLQQPNAVFQNRTFTSPSDFDSGNLSTGIKTSAGAIANGGYGPLTSWNDAFSAANVTAEKDETIASILGMPSWTERYEPNAFPESQPTPWTIVDTDLFVTTYEIASNALHAYTLGASGNYMRQRRDALSASKDSFMHMCWKQGDLFGQVHFGLWNGAKGAHMEIAEGRVYLYGTTTVLAQTLTLAEVQSYRDYHLLLTADGVAKLWSNGVLVATVAAATTAYNKVQWGFGIRFTDAFVSRDDAFEITEGGDIYVRRVYYNSDISTTAIPDTLPTTGTIILPVDLTRAPDSILPLWADYLSNSFSGACGATAASVTVQLASSIDMTLFAAAQVVDILTVSSRAAISNGRNRIIQSVDVGNKTITLDAPGGTVTTTSLEGVYIQGGSVAIASLTSDTSDFSTGVDPAGYVTVVNGAVPASAAKRYQRLKLTLTYVNYGNSPEITALYPQTLWTSPAITLGTDISAFRTFLTSLTTPTGVTQTVKVRSAPTTASPAEVDYGGWAVITNGDNIGTALADVTPPAARWLQIKVEQAPSSVGLLPSVESLVAQWLTGSTATLPVRGIVHKKRYLLCAATASAANNDIIIVLDRNDQWTKFSGLEFNALIHFKGNLYGMNAADAYVSLTDISGVYNDYDTAIDAFIETREEAFGPIQLRKDLRYSYLHWGRADASAVLTTYYRRPGESAYTGSGAFTFGVDGADVRQNYPLGTVGKMFQRKYRNAVINENMALIGETLSFTFRPAAP